MTVRFDASVSASSSPSMEERLQRDAIAAFGGQPGDVDITWCRIGDDRWGFVISMAHPEDLTLEITSKFFRGEVTANYLTAQNAPHCVTGTARHRSPPIRPVEQLGISRQMMLGKSVKLSQA